MASFQDLTGRTWQVEITIGLARRSFAKPEAIGEAIEDPYKRFDLLWLICEDQAKAEGIDAVAFDRLLANDETYVSANEALLEAIESFFRRTGKEALALLLRKTRAAAIQLDQVATAKVSTMDQTLTQVITKAGALIEAEITKAGNSFSNSPVSLESTPTP